MLDLTKSAAKQSNSNTCRLCSVCVCVCSAELAVLGSQLGPACTSHGGRGGAKRSQRAFRPRNRTQSRSTRLAAAVRRRGDGGEEDQRTRPRDHGARPRETGGKERRQKGGTLRESLIYISFV